MCTISYNVIMLKYHEEMRTISYNVIMLKYHEEMRTISYNVFVKILLRDAHHKL